MSNMTAKDWKIWIKADEDWELLAISDNHSELVEESISPTGKYNYIRKGKKTPNAIFFLTEKTMGDDFGFWAPKSVIISDENNTVELENWFEVKTIQFI